MIRVKFEIRDTKSETNSNNQNPKIKTENIGQFEHLNFDIVSNFEIRYSSLSA
jgi:hypothetical protein